MPHTVQTKVGVSADQRRGTSYVMLILNALVLCVGLALVMAYGGSEVTDVDEWGVTTGAVFSDQDIAEWADEVFAPQLAELGCDTNKRLAPVVAVRHAHKMRDGHFDSGVLRRMEFGEAWRVTHNASKTDDVLVEGWCK